MDRGYLLLEDGTVIEGISFGSKRKVAGEVVFTTSMVGYPESLTDPSYYGQILVFTYPLIGNYGVPRIKYIDKHLVANLESEKIWVQALVVTEYIDTPSHYSSSLTLAKWLKKEGIPALSGIDTRSLTKKLRDKGVMKGIIAFDKGKNGEFIDINKENLVARVSIRKPILYKNKDDRHKKPIVLFDCGVKHSIIRELIKRGFSILRVPWNWRIDNPEKYAGFVISNGPGDPMIVKETTDQISMLMKTNLPIFGICLGNQILALASGGRTFKLKYGHRSSNQPVQDKTSNRCFVTTQNHGFSVDKSFLSAEWQEWFVNLNDGTNEGILHRSKPYFTIQFHAEANPGPEDTTWIFDKFAKTVEEHG